MKAYLEEKEAVLKNLGTDEKAGLSAQQVQKSAEAYGVNEFSKEKKKPFLLKVLESMKEPMIIVLIVAALITLGVNIVQSVRGGHADFIEVVGIFAAIFLSVAITVVMEGRSQKAFDALNDINKDISIRCIRDGRVQMIPQREIVVGDIVLLETGNKIPADGRLLETVNLHVDESALTGESVPAEKEANHVCPSEKTPVAERANMVYSGCFVTSGSGTAVITGVGDHTEFGAIARELSKTDTSMTPIQEKLARLGKTIAVLGGIVAAAVFLIQVVEMIWANGVTLDAVAEAFITSIVLIVASVPEGLPTIVAISLAINMIKMSKQNALVKKMVACETIGCINVICSDKTGTLTQNRMTVEKIYENGQIIEPPQLSDGFLSENFCLNSTANVNFDGDRPEFIGNPTECAMLVARQKSAACPVPYVKRREQAEIVYQYPFSSETKNMTTVVRAGEGYLAYSKGSPEKILAQCSHIRLGGEVKELTDELRAQVDSEVQSFQKQAYRCLSMAHKEWTDAPDFENARGQVESGMVYDGFVAITDPLRTDVYAAVSRCVSAGIGIKMLTGDNIVTARAIAEKLQILDEKHIAVEAKELEELPDDELKKLLPKIRVIARSTPTIKMRVVKALKEMGDVVAVTGDGINDAPAIKNADVGVAMGIAGTEVSKEASDIVLLDDSFATIVKAVQWGRGIFENFRRFIQFQLTVNVSSVTVVLLSVLCGLKAPFTALQLLWINIIMDGPPALTLGLEPIRGDLMNRKPTRREENIVNRPMAVRIFGIGLYMAAVFMLQSFTNFLGAAPGEETTVLFTLFVLFQLFNAFNARELGNDSVLRNFASNKLMILVFALTFALQVLIVQFAGVVFKTVPLSINMWAKLFGTAFTVVLISELVKLVRRLFSRKASE